jgi:hypothetical protein
VSFFDYPTVESAAPPAAHVLLPDASESDWATILEFTRAVRFGAGHSVLRAGGGGRSLYMLLEGTLEVVTPPARFGRQRRIGCLEAGSLVGEVSFFDGAPRSAGVRALSSVVLAEIDPCRTSKVWLTAIPSSRDRCYLTSAAFSRADCA